MCSPQGRYGVENGMKQDNRGVTLIELLVVVAIMGIISGMLVISMGILPRTNAKSCANGLKTAIGQNRILTMGKKQTVLELWRDAEGVYHTIEKIDDGYGNLIAGNPELCGKRSVKVSYHVENGNDPLTDDTGYTELDPGDSMTLSFDRGSGKLIQGGAPDEATLCDGIKIEGGGAVYLIRIYTATGKVTLED